MDSLIPINVVIGDRSYRIRIDPKDEETVRGTVKVINDKIVEFKTQFAGKDMQDYIGMVVLWYATQQKAAGSQPQETNEISEKLIQLEALLDKPLR
jgi:cell division protein ZapA